MTRDKLLFLLAVAGGVLIADQVTKFLVLSGIPFASSVPVLPGWFDFTHVHNPGGAFGFLARQSDFVRRFMFLFVSGFAVVLIFIFYKNTPREYRWLETALALIFGGAVGNMVDRIRFGYVIDFLDVYWKDLHWPAFNIADSAICIGMGIFIFHVIFRKLPEDL